MRKRLEIQKQKQELLKKQIQEQKVTSNIPSHLLSAVTFTDHHTIVN